MKIHGIRSGTQYALPRTSKQTSDEESRFDMPSIYIYIYMYVYSLHAASFAFAVLILESGSGLWYEQCFEHSM
eukprot:COSAG02_NODE_2063_length_9965_cov_116.411920_3_plen_73_part_00